MAAELRSMAQGQSPQETPMPEDTPEEALVYPLDTVEIQGIYAGFPLTYITQINRENASAELSGLIAGLQAIGVDPLVLDSPAAPPPPPPANNGYAQPPANGGGYNGGYQGQPQQAAQPGGWGAPAWQTCGHGQQYVKQGQFGEECSYYSDQWFANSRAVPMRNTGAMRFYCACKPPRPPRG